MSEIKDPQIEPSEGATADPSQGEPEPTSQGEPQGTPDPKTQEGTPQWYKSQLDKNQNALTEKLTEQEQIWAEDKQKLESQLQRVLQEVETIKKPPGDVLKPPKLADSDDPEEVIKYLQETIEYNNKLNDKKFEQFEERFGKTENQLAEERQLKEEARNLEMVKSTSKGVWMQQGMTIEEAEECWNWQSTVKADDRIKTIGKMFKLKDGGNKLKDELKKREDMQLDGAAPGAGAGGAGASVDPNDFTKSTDHSNMYETK